MTTEEIIKGLESVKTECGKHLDEGFAWICKPIDEAIEVLKREPCTDAVSREEARNLFKSLDRWNVNKDEKKNIGLLYDDVMFGLVNLPPVTPERPKGEWEDLKEQLNRKCDIHNAFAMVEDHLLKLSEELRQDDSKIVFREKHKNSEGNIFVSEKDRDATQIDNITRALYEIEKSERKG